MEQSEMCPTKYKKAYDQEVDALDVIDRIKQERGVQLGCYRCLCGRYHLTSTDRKK